MLAPALRRIVQPACAACSTPTQSVSRATGLTITATTQALTHRPLHQRRHSSSKASSPPDEDSKAVPGPSQPAKSSASGKTTVKSSAGRGRPRKALSPSHNIPKVPSTTHLERIDVHTSSCFAMHRPISVTTPFPPASSLESFNSLFDAKPTNFSDVIYTLNDVVESLEAAGQFKEEVDLREPQMQAYGPSGAHMGAPLTTAELEQLLVQCVPFRPPPPPVPVEVPHKAKSASRVQPALRGPPKQKSWSVNVNVTESTDSAGRRTWTFAASEPKAVDGVDPVTESSAATDTTHSRRVANQPFLRRMYARSQDRQAYLQTLGLRLRPKMHLISVKRQRKIKMKKHKYKKLRKRTRIERLKLAARH
ncbi:hypothetical protein EJ05DRAFT_499887 [Pseudovirgaria hyperparasitica]|uniref:Small ribosomal subunit protein mS38 n=1 Tax=Pseudovirgaria hyperparasitica TaxID=470096 RepID=A0A6A6WB79_9PEZI|nr:uncharacterized protein EJ05DRAFT_499887 [Pseudovirgaria hyperparasitica]KAF2758361.1 hypothetical protein EJ05DRAFT_499887 [Pseudovirgaria hyperparasitica]